MDFTGNESLVLNRVQKGIPCVPEPFAVMASDTGISEDEVLDIISRLKKNNVIRNISGIFDGEKLGYFLSLVAFEVPSDKTETAGAIISSHPGVSHNYLRDHKYNIWFTLAEENEKEFQKTVVLLASKVSARDYLVLRNEKLLKIGVFLDMTGTDDNVETARSSLVESPAQVELDSAAKEAVALLQKDLPLVKRPFRKIFETGMHIKSEKELLVYFREFLEKGIMRRYAAVLRHVKAGYSSNAMTAWKVDNNTDIEIFLMEKTVSHLYFRTIYPGRWEYPLFAMIHARSGNELDAIIKSLSEKSGIMDYIVLPSLKEFKKKRVKYFSEEFNEWKRLYND
jgi:DNA-binding Lrp family transcriptional regulator